MENAQTTNTLPRRTVAIISGGTGALGHAVVKEFLRAGATVAVPYRNHDELSHLEGILGPKARALWPEELDLLDRPAVQRFVDAVAKKERRIDVLINLAGGYQFKPFGKMTGEDWDKMVAVNLTTAFNLTHAVVPHMLERRCGRVVSVSSRGAITAAPNAAHYNASKVGVAWLMESLAHEYVDSGITFNSILPSIIDTPANRKNMKGDPKQWVKPDDIAKVLLFLASPDSSPISGAKVPVYGRI
jgi:NAD(P)-dependent dehydrogenase (short-subunit alcohol dehydrogenase family)